jgi:hypothetical protein
VMSHDHSSAPAGIDIPGCLADLPIEQLVALRDAGDEVLTCLGAIGRASTNPIARILKNAGDFFENAHYPDGDVFDQASASQYYYHAHRSETGEHGHFHTFVRARGLPDGIAPAPYEGPNPPPSGDDAICHLVAVSMNATGLPVGLFTTNRWVTAESYFTAADTIRVLERFSIDHAEPCWATNRFLTALLRLFRPQIEALIRRRDETILVWQRTHSSTDVFEDRALETTSEMAIDIDDQIAAIETLLLQRGN